MGETIFDFKDVYDAACQLEHQTWDDGSFEIGHDVNGESTASGYRGFVLSRDVAVALAKQILTMAGETSNG